MRECFYYFTQRKWEGCLQFTALPTTLVPLTRESWNWLRLARNAGLGSSCPLAEQPLYESCTELTKRTVCPNF